MEYEDNAVQYTGSTFELARIAKKRYWHDDAIEAFMKSDKPVMRVPNDDPRNRIFLSDNVKARGLDQVLSVKGKDNFVQVTKVGKKTIPSHIDSDGNIIHLDDAYLESQGFEWVENPPSKQRRTNIAKLIEAFKESPHDIVMSPDDAPKGVYISVYRYVSKHPEDGIGVKQVNGKVYLYKEKEA